MQQNPCKNNSNSTSAIKLTKNQAINYYKRRRHDYKNSQHELTTGDVICSHDFFVVASQQYATLTSIKTLKITISFVLE